jgi:uncharacterized repeat protein (TIGR02543 family)
MPEEPTKTVSTPGGSVTDGVNEAAAEPTETVYTFGGWYTEKDGGGELFTESMPVEADITVYVKWIRADSGFTVSFDAGEEGYPEKRLRTVEDGETVGDLMPSEPTKTGYIFDGWYTEQDGGGSKFTESTPVEEDITVYAKWVTAFTVSFNADGGTPATQTLTVAVGGTVGDSMPSNPTKTGYIFDGWYTEDDDVVSEFTESTPIEEDITVYAKWVSVDSEFTVNFDADGGTPAEQPRTVKYKYGSRTVGAPNMPTPEKTDYIFDGWYTEQNGGGSRFTGSTPVSADITVYAKWTRASRTVTFNSDGENPETQTQTVESGETLGDSMPSDPTKTGHTFGGWYTASGDEETEFTASTTVSADITVYAKWTLNSYTVTFNTDGGDPATPPGTVGHGGSLSDSMPSNPGKTGHTFGGWYTEQNGGGSLFTASTTVSADITVYAKWTLNSYTVTFNADGGSPEPQPQIVAHDNTLSAMPSEPTKISHVFSGWYTSKDGGGSLFTGSTPVTADITVYANWTYTSHDVTFYEWNNSSVLKTEKVGHGETLGTKMPTHTRAGYTFEGWYTEQNGGGSKVAADTLIMANIDLYPKLTLTQPPSNYNLENALTWLSNNAVEGGAYTITLTAGETIGPKTLSYGGMNVSVTIQSTKSETETTVRLNTKGSLFTVENKVTLILAEEVRLYGGDPGKSNTASLVKVNSGGTFTMTGGLVYNNTNTSGNGGGVYVSNGGTFTMTGGTIQGNSTSSYGGGVYVESGGTLNKSNGNILGTDAFADSLKNKASGGGDAAYVAGTPPKKRDSTSYDSLSSGSGDNWDRY